MQERLRALVANHEVVYEIWPAKIVQEGRQITIGYDVVLIGTHGDHRGEMTSPGCGRCVEVWHDLEEIAQAVAPPPTLLTSSRVIPFSGAVHYARERGERPDIELVLEIRHKTRQDAPADDCEADCLNVTLSRLRNLGIPERRWRSA